MRGRKNTDQPAPDQDGPRRPSYSDGMRGLRPPVVLDTNVFVAAGFRPESGAAQILSAVRSGELRLIWDAPTRRETRRILDQIPLLSWTEAEGLFRPENEFTEETHPERFPQIPDPEDRKFAVLAHAAGAILVSGDDDLLADPHRFDLLVLTPTEFLREFRID